METNDETILHLDLELMLLKKFIQKLKQGTGKKFFAEELMEFFRDRIRYRVRARSW